MGQAPCQELGIEQQTRMMWVSLTESVLCWEWASAIKINDNPTRTSYSGVVGNAVKKQYGREDM